MRSRSFFFVATFLVLLLGSAGAVYAIDSSQKRRIAEGVTVSGVDVGGMTTAQARAELERALLDPLKTPVTVAWKDERFKLTPRQAKVGIDLDGSVDRALARSRRGSMVTRVWREVRGERLQTDVPVDVRYSRAAIRRLVRRIAKTVDEPARDAEVSFAGGQLTRVPSKIGRKVRRAALRREIDEKLLAAHGSKRVRVVTRRVKPQVTTKNVAGKYPTVLVVNRSAYRISLYKNLKLTRTYGIAVGQAGLETPAGRYSIESKQVNPAWHVPNSDWAGSLAGQVIPGGAPNNPLKARWLGIYAGVGIHGTADEGSIGSNASHGCIRMRVAEVIELFDQVPVGAPIYIA